MPDDARDELLLPPAPAPAPTPPWQDGPAVKAAQGRVLRVLLVAQVVGSFGTGSTIAVGSLLTTSIIDGAGFAGVSPTCMTLGAALFGVPMGVLAARSGRRRALGLGWLTASAGSLLVVGAAVTESPLLLVAGLLMVGSGTATTLQSRFAGTDLSAPGRRGSTLSLMVWSGTLGAVLGPNLGAPGELIESALDLPVYSGSFIISLTMFAAAGVIVLLCLRPDPLEITRTHSGMPVRVAGAPRVGGGVGAALRTIWTTPHARFALLAVIASHVSMVSLMTMTPVHMLHRGETVSLIGLTISMHVLGMFALSPLVGMATDRFGPVRVIVVSQLLFLTTTAVVHLGGHGSVSMVLALFLLGLAWSCGTVPGAILLSDSVPATTRSTAQGVLDTSMNAIAAVAALSAGPIYSAIGFGGLSLLVIVIAIPLATMLPRDRTAA